MDLKALFSGNDLSVFLPRCPLGANTQVRSELHMLATCLDELRQGRVLEVADILASTDKVAEGVQTL